MDQPVSRRKADTISQGVFLISLAFIFYFNVWWPGLLFGLGAAFLTKYYLLGRSKELILTLIILSFFFFALYTDIDDMLLPFILLIVGGYLIAKEYLFQSNNNNDQSKEE